jgi:hypothetical protein
VAERRYSEDEVGIILRTAAMSGAASFPSDVEGLTLEQLKEIATEVGIDGQAVEMAAQNLDASGAARRSPLLGTPVAPQYERWVATRVQSSDYADLLVVIRRAMGRQGIARTEMEGLEWSARDPMGGRYISIRPSGDRTLVRALGNLRDGAIVSFLGGGVLAGSIAMAVLEATGLMAALGLGTAPIIALAAYLPARLFWRWRFRAEDTALRDAVSGVVRQLQQRGHDAPGDAVGPGEA